jgi:hypothetical protein
MDNFVQAHQVALRMNQIVPLSQLLDDSGLKTEFFVRLFGFANRTAWYHKRKNLTNWTAEDVYLTAQALRRTPAEIFEALLWEIRQAPLNEIPPRTSITQKNP